MPRPTYCRKVAGKPGACVFKPAGVPACRLKWLNLTLDEFEAVRLADLDGLHQEEAAARMKISRQTFGRIVENARHKVAQALSSGMALSIDGGVVCTPADRCRKCDRRKRGMGCHLREKA
ncbi:MAG TPA: DUF134 domain-containing protein [bacterium]|nr:DUF134 domain-containing protein [bacterium]